LWKLLISNQQYHYRNFHSANLEFRIAVGCDFAATSPSASSQRSSLQAAKYIAVIVSSYFTETRKVYWIYLLLLTHPCLMQQPV